MTIDNLREILEAQLKREKAKLFESSLSRIMSHVQKAKDEGFAILTSWRQANDKNTNLTNFSALKNFVRSNGLGYIQLRGHWQECQDPNVDYDKCPPEQLKDSIEPSLMVFKINQKTATDLGKRFDQDAVVYAGPETGGTVKLFFKNGETLDLGEFNPMTIAQAYSEFRSKQNKALKNGALPRAERHFTFEGYSYPAQSFIEKLAEDVLKKNIEMLNEGLQAIPK